MGEVWVAIGSIGALWAAIAASVAAFFTYRIMLAGQKQVEVSQEQFRQSVEAERDAQLPILVPSEHLVSIQSDASGHLDRQPGYDRTRTYAYVPVRNSGAGIALNIWGVVFEAEPEYPVLKETGQHHSLRFQLPLEPGSHFDGNWPGGGLPLSGDTEIGTTVRYKLYAPRKPTPAEVQRGITEKLARLTLTYSDIFGRKHAAIYDYTNQYQWESVAYLRGIDKDLGDLECESLRDVPAYGAPDIPRAPSQ